MGGSEVGHCMVEREDVGHMLFISIPSFKHWN